MSEFKLDIGCIYGRWLVVEKRTRGMKRIDCRCLCGTRRNVEIKALLERKTRSCGCATGSAPSHGQSGDGMSGQSPTYRTWIAMKTRCTNHNHISYERYGGLGIRVCDRWLRSFQNFLDDMGERPDDMSLDRLDSYENYEPGNCRWATASEQMMGRRKRDELEQARAWYARGFRGRPGSALFRSVAVPVPARPPTLS